MTFRSMVWLIPFFLSLNGLDVFGAPPRERQGSGKHLPRIAEVGFFEDVIAWEPLQDYHSVKLVVSGPNGFLMEKTFRSGEPVSLDLTSEMPDGSYTYELQVSPNLSEDMRSRLSSARNEGQYRALVRQLRESGELPPESQSGYFTIRDGVPVDSEAPEPVSDPGGARAPASPGGVAPAGVSPQDQVILDDLIVDGSLCVGFDCVNGESFGFDTIRLKENNLRIKFQDTSSSASFPSNDWQITANDSSNGGANKFSIEDIDGGRVPFTIEAGAPSHSLYVDDGGRLGLGTSTPVVDAHVVSGNTPTLRLEQNGSSGFTPQTWDVAGNEANFFIRDATNGSTLPFRIRPGAPSSSIDIAGSGNVGIGTSSPGKLLHVRGTSVETVADNNSMVRVENASGTEGTRRMLELINNGIPLLFFQNNADGSGWSVSPQGTGFAITKTGTGQTELFLSQTGNLNITGNLTANGTVYPSDRGVKENLSTVDREEVLEKVAGLEISRWSYKRDPETVVHMGPMAQEFFAAFELGIDDRHLSPTDTAGVALAAIQGLYRRLKENEEEIAAQRAALASQQELIRRLEKRLEALSATASR